MESPLFLSDLLIGHEPGASPAREALHRQGRRRAGVRRIAQRHQPAGQKTLPPFAYGVNRHSALGGDGGVTQSGGAIQNDPSALGGALIGLGPPRHELEFGLLLGL